jgi:hypothetical protein
MWKMFEKKENIKTNEELFPVFLELQEQGKLRRQLRIIQQKEWEDKEKTEATIFAKKIIESINIKEEFKKYIIPRNTYSSILRIPYLEYDIVVSINYTCGFEFYYDFPNMFGHHISFRSLDELLMNVIEDKQLKIK